MVKKKLNILSGILLLVLCLGFSSSTYAMSLSEAFEYCRENCGYSSMFNTSNNDRDDDTKGINAFKNYIDNSGYTSMAIWKKASENDKFWILLQDNYKIENNLVYRNCPRQVYITAKLTYSFNNLYNTQYGSFTASNGYESLSNLNNGANSFYMVVNEGQIIAASFELPPSGLQFRTSTDYITVNIGNETLTDVIRTHKLSIIDNPIWGIIENYNELNTWEMSYNLYLVMPDNAEYLLDTPYLEFMNNEEYYVRSKGLDIKIGKIYKLDITYQEDTQTYYYFIDNYFNQVATGSTISYNYTSGDTEYTIQDQMQQTQTNQDEIMGFLTSSEVSSGEEPTLSDISVPVVPDATEDFFTWLMNSVLNILYDNTDSTLEIPLYNTTHYIRSDIYKFNIEPLKTFIQAGWWFIVGVPVLKYIRRSIERLKGGELPATDDKSDLLGNIL